MASAIYPKAKEQMLQAGINMASATVKAALIDTADYTYSAAHEFFSSVAVGAVIGTAATLGTKTFTSGLFDAADSTYTAVTGDQFEAIIIYVDTGSTATSRLIAYIDGLLITPDGTDITVVWSGSGIFQL